MGAGEGHIKTEGEINLLPKVDPDGLWGLFHWLVWDLELGRHD